MAAPIGISIKEGIGPRRSSRVVRDFRKFLSQTISEIIEAGTQTGEFRISNLSAAARVLIDCLAIVLEPSASPDPDNKLTEKRVRALVGFLGRALRYKFFSPDKLWQRRGGEHIEASAAGGANADRRIGQDEIGARRDQISGDGEELLIHANLFYQVLDVRWAATDARRGEPVMPPFGIDIGEGRIDIRSRQAWQPADWCTANFDAVAIDVDRTVGAADDDGDRPRRRFLRPPDDTSGWCYLPRRGGEKNAGRSGAAGRGFVVSNYDVVPLLVTV